MNEPTVITGRVLHAGHVVGEILKLDASISFWGGVDPQTGVIIDRAHPQVGRRLEGMVVAMPGSRGSSGTPGVLGETLRNGTGPAALLVTKPDVNLLAGAIVAEVLYGTTCPVVVISEAQLASLHPGQRVSVGD